MKEQNYYTEIENYIKRNEINKRRRVLEENYDTLKNYWEIGRLLVEAQGGSKKAKYGGELIKKWSIEFTKNYGKGYDATNLRRFRQFYLLFPKCGPMDHISWSHIIAILPIKDTNKRNYYLNLCIERNLSKRQLQEEIKSNSYERLINKPEHIELINSKNEYSTFEDIKNPILIKEYKPIKNEKDLELTILSELTFILTQFGKGYAFIGNQVKIDKYYIDILLFNLELKLQELRKEDKSQIEFYMKLVDQKLKKSFYNNTLGIIISKEQDIYVANFVRNDNLIPLTYKTIKK